MKRFLLIGMAMTMIMATTAVTAQKTRSDYNPYVSAGASIQNDATSYGGELGIYNHNSWYAVTVNSATSSPDNIWSVGAKGYWKVTDAKHTHMVDGFVYTGVSMALIKYHPLTLESGVAAVFNISQRFAPQVSFGFPIEQNAVLRNRPLGITAGLSLNYWIK